MIIITHLLLWIIWMSINLYERWLHSQPKPPFYISGSLGDSLGLTLVLLSFNITGVWHIVCVSAVLSIFATSVLHWFWSRHARVSLLPVTLYHSNGGLTTAGCFHLVHVMFLGFVIINGLLSAVEGIVSIYWTIFIVGFVWYTITVLIDYKRGILT